MNILEEFGTAILNYRNMIPVQIQNTRNVMFCQIIFTPDGNIFHVVPEVLFGDADSFVAVLCFFCSVQV